MLIYVIIMQYNGITLHYIECRVHCAVRSLCYSLFCHLKQILLPFLLFILTSERDSGAFLLFTLRHEADSEFLVFCIILPHEPGSAGIEKRTLHVTWMHHGRSMHVSLVALGCTQDVTNIGTFL